MSSDCMDDSANMPATSTPAAILQLLDDCQKKEGLVELDLYDSLLPSLAQIGAVDHATDCLNFEMLSHGKRPTPAFAGDILTAYINTSEGIFRFYTIVHEDHEVNYQQLQVIMPGYLRPIQDNRRGHRQKVKNAHAEMIADTPNGDARFNANVHDLSITGVRLLLDGNVMRHFPKDAIFKRCRIQIADDRFINQSLQVCWGLYNPKDKQTEIGCQFLL